MSQYESDEIRSRGAAKCHAKSAAASGAAGCSVPAGLAEKTSVPSANPPASAPASWLVDPSCADRDAYISISQAAALIAGGRDRSVIWQWAHRGLLPRGAKGADQRIRLRVEYFGRAMVTTRRWMDEFFVAYGAANKQYQAARQALSHGDPSPACLAAMEALKEVAP